LRSADDDEKIFLNSMIKGAKSEFERVGRMNARAQKSDKDAGRDSDATANQKGGGGKALGGKMVRQTEALVQGAGGKVHDFYYGEDACTICAATPVGAALKKQYKSKYRTLHRTESHSPKLVKREGLVIGSEIMKSSPIGLVAFIDYFCKDGATVCGSAFQLAGRLVTAKHLFTMTGKHGGVDHVIVTFSLPAGQGSHPVDWNNPIYFSDRELDLITYKMPVGTSSFLKNLTLAPEVAANQMIAVHCRTGSSFEAGFSTGPVENIEEQSFTYLASTFGSGSSGGPILNKDGKLVGAVSAYEKEGERKWNRATRMIGVKLGAPTLN